MKTVFRFAIAVFVLLLCLSAINMTAAILVPSLRAGTGLVQETMYTAESIATAPTRALSGVPVFAVLFVSVFLVAFVLRWAFGEDYRRYRRRRHSETEDASDPDLASLARDLHDTARRLEGRVEALETILLDRTNSRV